MSAAAAGCPRAGVAPSPVTALLHAAVLAGCVVVRTKKELRIPAAVGSI